MDRKEIKKMIDRANGLSEKGNNNAALQALREAWDQADFLPESKSRILKGLICHCEGRILRAMGKYEYAVESLQHAAGYRNDDPIQLAYTWFEMFICKVYGNIPISDEEVEATKMALLKAMSESDHAASDKDVGNMMQSVAYIEQVKGSAERAILLYEMALAARKKVGDERGEALTYAGISECYKELGEKHYAGIYGELALDFFEDTGDIEGIKQMKEVIKWVKGH